MQAALGDVCTWWALTERGQQTMGEHRFGGPWTEEKLARLKKYLHAYMTIFSRNPRAAYFKAIYADAFAGTGFRHAVAVASLPRT